MAARTGDRTRFVRPTPAPAHHHHNQKARDGARLERHDDKWHWYPPNTTEPWTSPVGPGLTLWDTS